MNFLQLIKNLLTLKASCFGDNGEGDENDNFMVLCRDYRLRHVKTFTRIYFYHIQSRKYLFISWRRNEFNQHNCRNCPFIGEKEVGLTYHKDDQAVWEVVDVLKTLFLLC